MVDTIRNAQTRNHRIPFLVAGAVAGLVFAFWASWPGWPVPYTPFYQPGNEPPQLHPPPPNWDRRLTQSGPLWYAVVNTWAFESSYNWGRRTDLCLASLRLLGVSGVAALLSFWVARLLVNRLRPGSMPADSTLVATTPATHP